MSSTEFFTASFAGSTLGSHKNIVYRHGSALWTPPIMQLPTHSSEQPSCEQIARAGHTHAKQHEGGALVEDSY